MVYFYISVALDINISLPQAVAAIAGKLPQAVQGRAALKNLLKSEKNYCFHIRYMIYYCIGKARNGCRRPGYGPKKDPDRKGNTLKGLFYNVKS